MAGFDKCTNDLINVHLHNCDRPGYNRGMSSTNAKIGTSPDRVLGTAVLRAAELLGLSRSELSKVLGRDRSSISRSGVVPSSKAGELATLLIRCYRSLAVLVDNNNDQMLEWMTTPNRHTGGIPREQFQSVAGLVAVTEYLDAIRAKV